MNTKTPTTLHLRKVTAGVYEGSGYRVAQHPTERSWLVFYPNAQGEVSAQPDDIVNTLAQGKEWAQAHFTAKEEAL